LLSIYLSIYYLEFKKDLPVFTCPVIIQEVLQGIRNDKSFEEVKDSFLALPVLTENPVDAVFKLIIQFEANQLIKQLFMKF
jgi:hypothetical protein